MLHSFGGRALDRHVFEFETDEMDAATAFVDADPIEVSTGEDGADPSATPSPSAEAEAVEVAPSAEAAAPSWLASEDDFHASVAEQAARVADQRFQQWLEQIANEAPAEDASPSEVDLLDPEQFAQFLEQRDQKLLQQFQGLMSPLLQSHEKQTVTEAQERVKDILSDIATREGEFDRDAAEKLAHAFLPEAKQRLGQGPRAAEHALAQAAKYVRSLEAKAASAAVEAYKNQSATIAGAPTDTAVNGSGTSVLHDDEDEMAVAERLINSR